MGNGHRIALGLSVAAFLAFIVNQAAEIAGYHLEFTGWAGAVILTGFLAVGMVAQLWKFMEGHRSRFDLIITILQLFIHVAAELAIWYQTKILNLTLPPELPLYIVGVYWVSGVADVFFRFIGREMQLFNGLYKSPEALLQEQLEVVKQNLVEAETAKALLQQQVSNAQASFEHERALLEQRLSSVEASSQQREALLQQQVSNAQRDIEKRDRQIEQINERIQKQAEEESKKYELSCDVSGCGFTTGLKDTQKAAENSLNGHKNRNHRAKANGTVSEPVVFTAPAQEFPSEGFR